MSRWLISPGTSLLKTSFHRKVPLRSATGISHPLQAFYVGSLINNHNLMALPIEIPPSPFVREAAEWLDAEAPSRILDAGCGGGRNSLYLARLGHEVLGVTNELADACAAAELANHYALGDCHFAVGDVRQLPVRRGFDVVMSNEVLHQLSKPQARGVIGQMQRWTRQGGLNIVSGYLVDPERASRTNREHCFHPGELRGYYENDKWDILSYAEDEFAFQNFSNRQLVHSLVKIVAHRRWSRTKQ